MATNKKTPGVATPGESGYSVRAIMSFLNQINDNTPGLTVTVRRGFDSGKSQNNFLESPVNKIRQLREGFLHWKGLIDLLPQLRKARK